jgi:outer membrane protein assembly factor BamB
MKQLRALIAVLGFGYLLAQAADWLNYGGDPQRMGWQRRERRLSTTSVKEMKLLWKRKLDSPSGRLNSLTAPVILGPLVTHRGIKELVFIAGASDSVYAVDVDLGTVFWQRRLKVAPNPDRGSRLPCGQGLTATPAFARPGGVAPADDQDEGFTPLRPLYVLSSDGNLHSIRPSDGADMAPTRNFIPGSSYASSLNVARDFVYATTSAGCGGAPDGVWALNVNSPSSKANFFPAKTSAAPRNVGVSVGSTGTIYSAFAGAVFSLTPGDLRLKDHFSFAQPVNVAPIALEWKGRELIAGAGKYGGIFLRDATGKTLFSSFPFGKAATRRGFTGSFATWQDAAGTRWLYVASVDGRARGSIMAFKVAGEETRPHLVPVWRSRVLTAPVSPVIANGMVFALATGAHAALYALDAVTGRELYSSGNALKPLTRSTGLAVANGHVCFGTSDSTLYCFGIPFEI